MAIRVRCPLCWETAEVPESALGKQGVCNACGASVAIPARLTKVCFICGADVTHIKHAKDLDNNYLCQSCWEARNPDQRAVFSPIHEECSLCHAQFAPGEGFELAGKPVCKDCHRGLVEEALAHDVSAPPPRAGTTPLPRAARNGRATAGASGAAALVVAGLALVASIGVIAWQVAAPSWERENTARILTLKAQAEVLVSVGKFRDGLDKYAELAQLVNGRIIRDGALRETIRRASGDAEIASRQMAADTWEQEHTPRLLVLKGQAEMLIALGHVKEGIEKYNRFIKLASGHVIHSPLLEQDIVAVHEALEAAYRENGVSGDLPTTRPAAVAQNPPNPARIQTPPSPPVQPRPTVSADAPKTQPNRPRSIFDD